MTRSGEPAQDGTAEGEEREPPLGPAWRAGEFARQQQALPGGRVVASCGVPFGAGGLGRHLQEIMEALERAGRPGSYISESNPPPQPRIPGAARLLAPLARLSPGWRVWSARVQFDAAAARALPDADHLLAFNRQALAQFHAARHAGYQSVGLVTGSPHLRRVARQHALAYKRYPIERSFGTLVVKRYLTEYERADRIYVASRYTWESFSEQGIPDERLALFPLTPDPRYTTREQPPSVPTFNVVYAGSLSVAKGVPLLIDAFRALPRAELRLILVGRWKSPAMRRWLERVCAEDPRIEIRPGDPLPHLRQARLFVHPAYEDGFAYAPAEALACGVPVLVSEDTGMKELIEPGRTGLVLPTGDLDALTAAIDAARRGEILDG
jgi:glycosyltransferase involved in cell wall biosynthesis